MPCATSIAHEGCGLGKPRPLPASGMSTRHWRQLAAGSSRGWSQKRGIWIPSSSAARMIIVPFGTLTWKPSMVSVTISTTARSSGWGCLDGHLLPHTVASAGSNGQPPISKCLRYSSRKCCTEE